MKHVITLAMLAITATLAVVAHELCFEATTFGGWLPFIGIVAGPIAGFFGGRVHALCQFEGEVETLINEVKHTLVTLENLSGVEK